MSVLSATTPILKGQLSDHDFRWEVIEQAVDCRTAEEKDDTAPTYICKSRYSTVSRYISNHEYVRDFHNDCHFPTMCAELFQSLREGGLDRRLAAHIGCLFIRSPLPVYEKEVAFPCCSNEQAEQILERLEQSTSPGKVKGASAGLTPVKAPKFMSSNNLLAAAATDATSNPGEEAKNLSSNGE